MLGSFPLTFTNTHTNTRKKGNKQITPRKFIPKFVLLGVENCCLQPGGLYSIPRQEGLLNIIFITNRGAYVCVWLGNTQIGWQGSLAT